MDHNFEIGEVVVCINAKRRWYSLNGLKKDEMYTVVGFNPYDGGLILKEVKAKSGYNAYRADRFRKVDYNFAENLLNTIKPEITIEEQKVVAKVKTNVIERLFAFEFLN